MKKSLFMVLSVVMSLFLASSAYASVQQGRATLFSDELTYGDFLKAHSEFEKELGDPEANLFYSVIKPATFILDPDDDLGDIFYAFGLRGPKLERYLHEGPAYDVIEEPDPNDYPSISELQTYLYRPYLDLHDDILDKLSIISSGFSTVLKKEETGAEVDITVDYGEVLLYKALVNASKVTAYVQSSYNLDIDIVSIFLELEKKGEELPRGYINKQIDDYPEFLKLVNDAQDRLQSAKGALLAAIDHYTEASNIIRNRASEAYLITLDQKSKEEEEFFRDNLEELKDSILVDSRAAKLGDPDDLIYLNPSPFFGDKEGPFDLRDFLPHFDQCNNPICGTMGHGLDNDPTLGGIFPYMTHADWYLDTPVCLIGMPWIYLLLDN